MKLHRKINLTGIVMKFNIFIDGKDIGKIGVGVTREISLCAGEHSVFIGIRGVPRSEQKYVSITKDDLVNIEISIIPLVDLLLSIVVLIPVLFWLFPLLRNYTMVLYTIQFGIFIWILVFKEYIVKLKVIKVNSIK